MTSNSLGKYQIIREIGRSNDIVYEATDTSINRRVAIKELLLPPNIDGTQRRERVERFYREARAAGSLSHPNIVTIFEAGEDHGRHFIAMEFLEGQTLRDIMQIEGKLTVEKAVEFTKQICDGLTYAHSKGVVHRDIKPDNIQVLPGGRVKITDFGIARIMEEPTLTANGQVFGTPSYMSPEQVAGKPIDARTDLFSLGVMLFEMLTGHKPFTGDSVVTITYNIMNQDVSVPPVVPTYLERVIRRCLQKDPDMRYSSAAEVATDLDPSNFQGIMPTYQMDPSSATVGMPQYGYGPVGQTQAPPTPPPNPFGGLKPGDLPMPRLPSEPLLSADQKYFAKIMLGVIGACALTIALLWLVVTGYQGWRLSMNRSQVDLHIKKGNDYYNSQSYSAAVEQFDMAIKLGADKVTQKTLRRDIAVCYTQLGVQAAEPTADKGANYAQAATYFQQAVTADNTYADGYLQLGSILAKMNREDEALAAWDQASKLGGEAANIAREDTAALYVSKGDNALNNNDPSAATDWWKKALETAPGTAAGNAAQQRLEGGGNK